MCDISSVKNNWMKYSKECTTDEKESEIGHRVQDGMVNNIISNESCKLEPAGAYSTLMLLDFLRGKDLQQRHKTMDNPASN